MAEQDGREQLIALIKRTTTGPAYERISRVLLLHPEWLQEVVQEIYAHVRTTGQMVDDKTAKAILYKVSSRHSRNGKIEFR